MTAMFTVEIFWTLHELEEKAPLTFHVVRALLQQQHETLLNDSSVIVS